MPSDDDDRDAMTAQGAGASPSASPAAGGGSSASLPKTIRFLGWVSFLTDVSADMISPLIPLFLTGTLHASLAFVGTVDGAAETTAALFKLIAGRMSDRARRRKPLTAVGYAIASFARPLVAVATAPWHVLLTRVTDRIGKGIRTSPRDAWIAESVRPEQRARAYGFHRGMDNAGAFLGPLVAIALLRGLGLPLRTVFGIAAIPGVFAVLLIVFGMKEERPSDASATPHAELLRTAQPLPRQLKLFFAVLFLFTLANASDYFLVLKAKQLGFDETAILLCWTGLSGLRALLASPGSLLSDRLGRQRTLMLGWLVFAVVFGAFSFASGWLAFVALLAAYAGYYGLTEGAERALVADLAPPSRKGFAFGLFHGTIALGALPASAAFGAIADRAGLDVAFRCAAVLALVAASLLAWLVRGETQRSAAPQ